MTWFIINHLTSPIQEIIKAIRPYQKGETYVVPTIELKNLSKTDEFVKLADTLNSLSVRVQSHITNLTHERNQKKAILESLIEGVIAVDVNMTITYANTMASKILENNQLLGQSFNDPQNQIPHAQKFYSLILNCQVQSKPITETLNLKRDSQKHFLDIIAAPKKENNGAILVCKTKLHTTNF